MDQTYFSATNIIISVFCFLFGLLCLVKPGLLWKLEHGLWTDSGEPSDLYLVLTRVGGGALILFAIAALFIRFNG